MELADDQVAHSQIEPERYRPRTPRSDLQAKKRFSAHEALEVGLALTKALHHLHDSGLIHRDVKPTNVIFVNGLPKLADIGLVTRSGEALSYVGTEGYVPPEGPGSVSADIFSLGKTIYEMVTGKDRLEFPRMPTVTEAGESEQHLFELNEILLRACNHDPRSRYQTAAEMHEDLLLLKAGKSVRRSRLLEARLIKLTRAAAVFGAMLVLAISGYIYQQSQTREARRLAAENRALSLQEAHQRRAAETAKMEAEGAARLEELRRISQLFEADQSRPALALLAHRVRTDPEDSFARRRLLSALTYRSYALPLADCNPGASILGADLSPDGRFLATATAKGEAVFWELETGEELARVAAGQFVVTNWNWFPVNVHFDATGTRMVTPGGQTCAARIWSVSDAPRLELQIDHPFSAPDTDDTTHAEFSPDGSRILTTHRSGDAFVWDAATGEQLVALPGSEQFSDHPLHIVMG